MFKNKSENCLHFLSSHPRLFYPPDREFSTSCCINRHRRSAKTKPTHRPFGRTNFACSSNDLPSPCWIFRTSRKRYESERETEVSNFRNAARMFFRAKIPPSQKGWKMAFSWSGKVSFLLGFRLKHPHVKRPWSENCQDFPALIIFFLNPSTLRENSYFWWKHFWWYKNYWLSENTRVSADSHANHLWGKFAVKPNNLSHTKKTCQSQNNLSFFSSSRDFLVFFMASLFYMAWWHRLMVE